MTSTALKDILHRAENWPVEDQEHLLQAAQYIERPHSSDFSLTGEDWKIIAARLEAAADPGKRFERAAALVGDAPEIGIHDVRHGARLRPWEGGHA